MTLYDMPLTREEVEMIAARAELCAEATISGEQLRGLAEMALAYIKQEEKLA